MCLVVPFTLPCCPRVYVEVSKLPSCPNLWPNVKCPPELCIIQFSGYGAEQKESGTCWRCLAKHTGASGCRREFMRPKIDRATQVLGPDAFEIGVTGRKRKTERDGECWFCGAKRGCRGCGSKEILEGEGDEKPDFTGFKRSREVENAEGKEVARKRAKIVRTGSQQNMKPPARKFDYPDPSGASQWQQQQQQQQPYPQLYNSDPHPSSQVPRTFNKEVGIYGQDLGAYPVGEVSYHGLSPTAESAFDGRSETQQAGRWQTIHIQQNNIAGPSHIPPNQQRQQQQQLTQLDRDRRRVDLKPENQLSRLSSRPGGPNPRPQPHQGYGSSRSDQGPQLRGRLVGSRAQEMQPQRYYPKEYVASAGFLYQNTSLYPQDPPPLQQYGSSLLPFHIDNNSSPNFDPQKYHSGDYAEFSGIKPALREYQAPQRPTAEPSSFNTAQHQVGSDGSHGFIPPQRDFHGYAQSTHVIDPALQATDNPQQQQTHAERSSNNKDGNTDRNQPCHDPSNDGYVPYFNQDLQLQPGNMPQANFADMDKVTLAPMYGCALPAQSQQYSTGQSSGRQSVTEKGKGAGQQTQDQQL